MGCRTEGIQDWRVAVKEGYRTRGIQQRKDTGKVGWIQEKGFRTVGMRNRRDAWKVGCKKGGMQERRGAGMKGFRRWGMHNIWFWNCINYCSRRQFCVLLKTAVLFALLFKFLFRAKQNKQTKASFTKHKLGETRRIFSLNIKIVLHEILENIYERNSSVKIRKAGKTCLRKDITQIKKYTSLQRIKKTEEP